MSLKKSYCLLLVLLLMPLVLVGVVQSVAPPTIYINVSSYGINVIGSGWTANAEVTIYYDVEDADHMVATVTANYAGNFQTYIPTNYVATVGAHTVIAVQGADKATAVYNVGVVSPPDDRLLNPIKSIKDKLDTVGSEIQAVEAKLDPNGSFYNFTNDWFSTINETIVEKVDYEALEVEVHTIQYDTPTNYSEYPFYGTLPNTQIGGADRWSCVFVTVTFRGEVVDDTNAFVFAAEKDALKTYWSSMGAITIEPGVTAIFYQVFSGTPAGSYLVEAYAQYWSDGVEYRGATHYVIDCTSTTT